VEQPVQNGTAGAVQLAEPYVDSDVLIIFVDTLFDADLSLVKRLPEDCAGVIWAKEVEDYQRFGVIVTDDDGNMKRIVEKPTTRSRSWRTSGSTTSATGSCCSRASNATMKGRGEEGEYYLTDAFQYMIDHGAKIRVEEVAGWYDCGQMETLLDTNRHLLETGRARQPDGGRNVRIHAPVRIAEGVTSRSARSART
jgi:glucose-1-phosphate thymidylyltransferase